MANKLGFAHALIILGVLVVGAVALMFLLPRSTNKTTEETLTPSPTQTPDSAANWKTFTSGKYGYSFQYPTNWYSYFFDEKKSTAGTNTVQNYDPMEIEKYSNHGTIDYKKLGRSIGKVEITVIENGVTVDNEGLTAVTEPLKIGDLLTQVYKADANGYFTYIRVLRAELRKGQTINVLLAVHNFSEDENKNDLEEPMQKILSSFKFTNQALPTCKPRPACLDATPRCMIPETSDMCPPTNK